MPEIITRAEAKARGLKRYFTGEPCKHGHLAERTTRDGVCQACKPILDRQCFLRHREKRLAAMRKYYAANEDRFRKSRKKWEDSHPEKARDCKKKYNKSPRRKACQQRYYKKNLAKIREKNRLLARIKRAAETGEQKAHRAEIKRRCYEKNKNKYRATSASYASLNASKLRHSKKIWSKKNPEKVKQYRSRDKTRNYRERYSRNYYHGPSNPKGEMQWLKKNKVQLRNVKRYLRNRPREQSASSQPET